MKTWIKRFVRLLIVVIGFPLSILNPITGAFWMVFAMYVVIMFPLFQVYHWATNDEYRMTQENESLLEMLHLLGPGMCKWVWVGK